MTAAVSYLFIADCRLSQLVKATHKENRLLLCKSCGVIIGLPSLRWADEFINETLDLGKDTGSALLDCHSGDFFGN